MISTVYFANRMTANQRMSKLSYDKTEFTWSLLAGWDYAIGKWYYYLKKLYKIPASQFENHH